MAPRQQKTRSRRRARPRDFRDMLPSQVKVAYAIHPFYRRAADVTVSGTGGADSGSSLSTALSLYIDPNDFANLFDEYRIKMIEWEFVWQPFNGATSATNYPTMFYALDNDGSAAPSSILDVQSHGTCKAFNFSPDKRTIKIRTMSPGIVATAAGGNSVLRRSPWLDMGVTTEVHYGYVAWFRNYNNSTGGTIAYYRTIHFECRGSR